jgi:hypothetical protein
VRESLAFLNHEIVVRGHLLNSAFRRHSVDTEVRNFDANQLMIVPSAILK